MPKLNWNPPKPPTRTTATYTWNPQSDDGFHYAALVRNGGTLRSGTRIPPRKWDEYALGKVDLANTFADSFRRSDDLQRAFRDTAQTYNREMQKAIASRIWDWPRRTVRKSGEVVGSPRDIVDTGNLLDSQKLEFGR